MNLFSVSLFRRAMLFGLFILVSVQASSAIDLRYHWASNVVLLVVIALETWNWKPLWQKLALAISVFLLTLVILFWTWYSGISTYNFIAGLLPFSDAAGYYSDAQRILAGNPISGFSSRRPLFSAFLAGALAVAGNDLQIALFFITIFRLLLSQSVFAYSLG